MKEIDFVATGKLRLYSPTRSGSSEPITLPFRPNHRVCGDGSHFIGEVRSHECSLVKPGDEIAVTVTGVMSEKQYAQICEKASWQVDGGPSKIVGEVCDARFSRPG